MEERFLKFSNLSKFPGVIHGISTRNYGDMRFSSLPEDKVIENRKNFLKELGGIDLKDVVYPKLSHRANVFTVSLREKGKGAEALETAVEKTDALITREKGIFLMVTTADCLPILIYDPIMSIVAAVHAGWRGIAEQIISKTIQKMADLGSEGQNVIVGIGPGICQKHFVVKNDVLEKFKDLYPSATLVRNHDGYVDLKKAVLIDLKHAGIPRHNVEIANDCPVCHNGVYGSFRKEGVGAPASAAVIGMR